MGECLRRCSGELSVLGVWISMQDYMYSSCDMGQHGQ